MIETDKTNTTKGSRLCVDATGSMVISQRDINSLQKTLDQELARRAEDANEHLDTIIAEQGMYATVVIPMSIHEASSSRLMIRRAL